MAKLTNTQLIVLSKAQREDGAAEVPRTNKQGRCAEGRDEPCRPQADARDSREAPAAFRE